MPTFPSHPDLQLPLRSEAEARLREGTAPKATVTATHFEALSVLQSMAAAPESASAALKLLHELQVHQVELDLQHEQLEQSREELRGALDQFVERFEFAPTAYFVVERGGRIVEANRLAAEAFGLEPSALSSRRLESLLAPQCQFACMAMLKRLRGGSTREAIDLQVDRDAGVTRRYRMVATVPPSGLEFMVMLLDRD